MLHKTIMKSIIKANGHLILEGDESRDDLIHALLYLRQHTYARCHHPELGAPIESLLPDSSVLTVKSTRSRNVHNVDMSGERL